MNTFLDIIIYIYNYYNYEKNNKFISYVITYIYVYNN